MYFRLLLCLIPVLGSQFSLAATSQLSLGTQYLEFTEYSVSGDVLDVESGWLKYMELSQQWNPFDAHVVELSGSILNNTVNYNGHTQSGAEHRTNTEQDFRTWYLRYIYLLDTSYEIGVQFLDSKWDRNILPANGIRGLNETYHWKGAGMYSRISGDSLKLSLSVIRLFDGQMDVDLSEVNRGVIAVPLPNAYQVDINPSYIIGNWSAIEFSLSLPITWRYFSRSDDVHSNGVTLAEPENESYFIGVTVSAAISY